MISSLSESLLFQFCGNFSDSFQFKHLYGTKYNNSLSFMACKNLLRLTLTGIWNIKNNSHTE